MATHYNNPALSEEPRNQRAKIIITPENESLYNWLERTGRFKPRESEELDDDPIPEDLEDIIDTVIDNLNKEETQECDL